MPELPAAAALPGRRKAHPRGASWCLSAALLIIALAGCAAKPAKPVAAAQPTGDPLLDSLDLSRPDLAKVKKAIDQKDYPAARKAFADHLRTRKNVVWKPSARRGGEGLPRPDQQIADDALNGRYTILNVPYQFKGLPDWKFNATDYPESGVAKTHEWTWVLNRHRQWVSLARTYKATGDKRYAQRLSAEIADWVAKNPPAKDPSARAYSTWRQIEAGIRMNSTWPEVFFTLVDSPDVFPDDVMLAMVNSMRLHADHLEKYPTRRNWKTMETNGLFHVGVLFPEFSDSKRWQQVGLQRQRDELDVQVYPDGAQVELTPGYHNVALQNFLETYKLAVLNKIPVPDGYLEHLGRMFDLNLWALMPDRTTPNFNDSSRGEGARMLAEGLKLFPRREDWRWIVTDGKEGKPPEKTSLVFPYAGWAVMRSGWDRDARGLIMDAGLFGLGHQHEDKLSFILDAFGARLVIEQGVYAYDVSEMRKHAISAAAHNVISIDGMGQNRKGGPASAYEAKKPLDLGWKTSDDFDYAQGTFGTGPDEKWGKDRVRGFTHKRQVLFAKPDYWVVVDTLTPADDKTHTYISTFHLDTEQAKIDDAKTVTTQNTGRANIAIMPLATKDLKVETIKGQLTPEIIGWATGDRRWDERRPVPAARFKQSGKGTVHFLYVFSPAKRGEKNPIMKVETEKAGEGELAAKIVFDEKSADRVRLGRDGAIHFEGRNGKTFHAP